MHRNTKRKHMIDFLFPIVLFFVFTLSALTILLLAANIYRSTIDSSTMSDNSRTSLAYISEKVLRNDSADSVSVGTLDGCDALILKQVSNNETYYSYIYAYDQELKELFLKKDTKASADSGKTILKIRDFSIEPLSDNLIRFRCTDSNGNASSIIVGLKTDQSQK